MSPIDQTPHIDTGGSPADVPGFAVGHAGLPDLPSGLSVILCPPETLGGMAVAGSAPGTRQTDGLRPENALGLVNAVLLTGGSIFGLNATAGVQRFLEERGQGVKLGSLSLPLVPTAVIFDLPLTEGRGRPGPALAHQACLAAGGGPMARGNVGAGTGATVGKLFGITQACKGGLGGASLTCGELKMGALAVVNAFGDIIDDQGRIMAGARGAPQSHDLVGTAQWFMAGNIKPPWGPALANTTLGVITTNARLDKAGACKVAALAHHGLVRAIDPVHTLVDGDLVMVLSAGEVEADLNGLGVMAARLMRLAILDGVNAALSLPGLPAARDLEPIPLA